MKKMKKRRRIKTTIFYHTWVGIGDVFSSVHPPKVELLQKGVTKNSYDK